MCIVCDWGIVHNLLTLVVCSYNYDWYIQRKWYKMVEALFHCPLGGRGEQRQPVPFNNSSIHVVPTPKRWKSSMHASYLYSRLTNRLPLLLSALHIARKYIHIASIRKREVEALHYRVQLKDRKSTKNVFDVGIRSLLWMAESCRNEKNLTWSEIFP